MKYFKLGLWILLASLFISDAIAGCTNKISTYTKTVNFGTVIVQRDAVPGSIVATQSVQGTVNIECTGSEPHIYIEKMYTPLTAFGNNVYDIGVNGFGLRLSENGTNGDMHHYFPVTIQGWTGGTTGNWTNENYLYKFEIIKISNFASSGYIRTGMFAETSFQNEFYIGYFNIGGGNLQVVQCSINTPSLTFPIGDIKAASFGTTVGTIPANAQSTQNLGLNCDYGANINVSLSGVRNPDVANNSVLALTNQGSAGVATGVGVQLLYNGAPLSINNRIVLKRSAGGQETFPLTARYYQTKNTVTTGTANTSATLNITYQ